MANGDCMSGRELPGGCILCVLGRFLLSTVQVTTKAARGVPPMVIIFLW